MYPKPKIDRGEIVVVISKLNRAELFVRRVIGIAGDRIHIARDVVYLNGQPQAEPYVKLLDYGAPESANFPLETALPMYAQWTADMLQNHVQNGELVVLKGYCFLLGDSRHDSLDDRFTGLTPEADIIGKALFIYSTAPGTDARRIFKPL
jgi:signal peptidase I